MAATAGPVSVTINNNPSIGHGWLGSAWSGVGQFFTAHPYIAYACAGVLIGTAAYLLGGQIIGRSAESSLADPASVARVIQSNANLRAEMERTRSAINEARDALVDLKLEFGRSQGNAVVELAQQRQATDAVARETVTLLTAVNSNVLAVHETVVQLASASGQM